MVPRPQALARRLLHSRILLFLLAFSLSFGWVLLSRTYAISPIENHFSFGYEMGRIAASLVCGNGYSSPFPLPSGPTAFAPPAYPLLILLVFKLLGVYSLASAKALLFLNCVFSGLTAVLLRELSVLILNDFVGLLAGWAWALYPYAAYVNSHDIWETPLTTLLLTLLVLIAYRLQPKSNPASFAGFGALGALAVLSNSSAILLVAALWGWLAWKWRPSRDPEKREALALPGWKPLSITVLGFVFLMSPWWIRNYLALGKPVPLRTNFWLEFWTGNCFDGVLPGHGKPEDYFAYTDYDSPKFWVLDQRYANSEHPNTQKKQFSEYTRLGEMDYMASKRAASLRCIASDPKSFLDLSARRFVYTWTTAMYIDLFLGHPIIGAIWVTAYTTLSLLALIGLLVLWKVDAERSMPFLLALSLFPAIYYISHISLRYRYPIDPLIFLLAAIAIDFAVGELSPMLHRLSSRLTSSSNHLAISS